MSDIVFLNASTGESKKLDLKTVTKKEAFKAFKDVMTKKETKKGDNQKWITHWQLKAFKEVMKKETKKGDN